MMFDGMEFVSADSMFQPNEVKSHTSLPSSPSHLFQPYPPQDFHGVLPSQFRKSMSFSGIGSSSEMEMQLEDDMSDDGLPLGEKKRRLTMEQVKALEKSFELGNKLDTERKTQLARSLGLQPRQVAIWFQNRRARWKTKQLEKDYVVLKKKFEAVKAQNDQLQAHNKTLHSELLALKGRESAASGHIHLNLGPAGSDIKFQKIDQMVPDEGLSNMFVAINDEQPGYWPWAEQQHFH